MARFAFRLDPVLKHRERIEDEKSQVFAVAQQALQDAEKERLYLVSRRDDLSVYIATEHASFDSDALRIAYAHLGFLAREIRAAEMRVATCVEAAARAQDELIAASKERRILERLRERKQTVFDQEHERAEQRELDDANSLQHARNQAQGVSI
ncbi:MAG: flagellar export protein FliJ [Candidatus Eremiobacteraeota bacterium]|nr:flagellar export protein FliJ [Candidatus Eremiobacteraeota bacterium]MBV8355796.1 flagellar export protein FliJ [Candidatus Eremiobacteraeota bacterium]